MNTFMRFIIAALSAEFWTSDRTATHLKCPSIVTRPHLAQLPSPSRTLKKPVFFYILLVTSSYYCVSVWPSGIMVRALHLWLEIRRQFLDATLSPATMFTHICCCHQAEFGTGVSKDAHWPQCVHWKNIIIHFLYYLSLKVYRVWHKLAKFYDHGHILAP